MHAKQPVWQPKSPKMSSKQKVAYVMSELGFGAERKHEVIYALQECNWRISDALLILRARGRH